MMNKNRKVCRQNQATGVTPKFLVIQGFWNRAGNNTFKQGPSINLSRMLLSEGVEKGEPSYTIGGNTN